MNINRVWAMVLRHINQLIHDMPRLINMFYWPLLDILLFGYFAVWVQKTHNHDNNFANALFAALVFWQIVIRANFDVSWNALEEIWSANMTNLFATPLTITEWMMSSVLFGFIMFWGVLTFCALIVYLAYGYNLFTVGWWGVLIMLNLFMNGLSIGFFSSGFLFNWGSRVQSYVFMIGWFFSLFAGIYYPVEVLPVWMQKLAYTLPFVYIFEALKKVVKLETTPIYLFSYASILSVVYLIATILFFLRMFEKSREKGLARLVD